MKSVYHNLSRIRVLSNNYALKFLFIAFVGIHIPLIVIVTLVVMGTSSATVIIVSTLFFTLIACAFTLYILHGLLSPLHQSRQALDYYLLDKTFPSLPLHYGDEAGLLMNRIQSLISSMDIQLKDKEELAALLTHDLRTPLGNIVALARLSMDEQSHEVVKSYLMKITELAEGQLNFTKNLLRRMKEDPGTLTVNLKPTDIDRIIKSAIEVVSLNAKQKGINIKYEFENAVVRVDEDMMVQVFQNLLSNAIKFSFPDSTIWIISKTEGDRFIIQVTDTGIGFTAAQSHELFKHFTTMSRQGTMGEDTVGLGLYLTKKHVEINGGSIAASSEGINKGAVFTIQFPLD